MGISRIHSSGGYQGGAINIDVQGFEELKRKITLLANDKDKRREVKLILKRAAKPTLDAVRMNTPVGVGSKKRAGGSLKKSINFINSKAENPTVLIGARVNKGKIAIKKGRYAYGDGWYAHFVDLGHNIYSSKKGGDSKKGRKRVGFSALKKYRNSIVTGRTKASSFMSKSYQQTYFMVSQSATSELAKFIQQRINKLS